jgi:hypothetical protein
VAAVSVLVGCTVAPAGVDAAVQAPATPLASATPTAAAIQPLGAGFLGPNTTPTPEATVSPEPGSWDGVTPPDGYSAVLITTGQDVASTTVATAVQQWATGQGVDLTVLAAASDDEVEARINEAVALDVDLVFGAGTGVIDVFALLTAQHLGQDFLVIGAELPEPTENVTSVTWPGATFRGSGLGTSGDLDPATTTLAQSTEAVSAGVASVLHGLTGIVLSLPLTAG